MNSRFPDLTFLLDAAGRYSHSKETPLVFSAVAIQTKAISELRTSLLTVTKGNLAKWSEGKMYPDTVKAIFRLLAKRQLYWTVWIIWKSTAEWDRYFQAGEELYQKVVKNAQEAATYAKPMNTLKLHQFSRVSADLLGFFLGRHPRKRPRMGEPIQPITITAIHDSDIQGPANQQVFRNVLEGVRGNLPQTIEATRIKPFFEALIKTEQEEPLLLLPDYIAGYHYSRKAYGIEDLNEKGSLLMAVEPLIKQIPEICYKVTEEQFREEYLLPPTTFDFVLPKNERERLLKEFAQQRQQRKASSEDSSAC